MKRTANTTAYLVLVTLTCLLVGVALCAANSIRVGVVRRHLLKSSDDGYVYEWDEYRHRKYEWGWPAAFLTHTEHERKVWREAEPDLPVLAWRPIPRGWERAVQSSLDIDNLLLNAILSLLVLVCTGLVVANYGHQVVALRFSLKTVWLFMSFLCVVSSFAAFEYSMRTGSWWLNASELESHPLSPYRMYVSLTWRPFYVRIPILLGGFCTIGAAISISTSLTVKLVRGLAAGSDRSNTNSQRDSTRS